jgi:hypothetical protein
MSADTRDWANNIAEISFSRASMVWIARETTTG